MWMCMADFIFFRKINYFGQKWPKMVKNRRKIKFFNYFDKNWYWCLSFCMYFISGEILFLDLQLELERFWTRQIAWFFDQIYLQVELIDLIDFLTGKQKKKKSVLLFFIRCGQVCPSLHIIVRVTQKLSKSCSYTETSRDTKIKWKKSLLALQPVTILKLIHFLGVFKFCNETNGSKLQNTVQMYFLEF